LAKKIFNCSMWVPKPEFGNQMPGAAAETCPPWREVADQLLAFSARMTEESD